MRPPKALGLVLFAVGILGLASAAAFAQEGKDVLAGALFLGSLGLMIYGGQEWF